jgi:hypothetical protein
VDCREFAVKSAELRLTSNDLARRSLGAVRPVPPEVIERLAALGSTSPSPGWAMGGIDSTHAGLDRVHRIRRVAVTIAPAGALVGALLVGVPIHTHLYPTAPTLCRVHPELPRTR